MNTLQSLPHEGTMPIVKIRTNRQVTIPKRVFDALGLREGDFVEVSKLNNTVIIKPKKLVDPEDTLTHKEETLVAKGLAQIQRGETVPWNTVKHDLGL